MKNSKKKKRKKNIIEPSAENHLARSIHKPERITLIVGQKSCEFSVIKCFKN